jgi:alpha-tubulin suppressor-like RCC1 family protein
MLIRTKDGAMSTPSDYLEDINDIAAGLKHSLALDVNGFVWSWGNNLRGQPQKTPHFGNFLWI